MSSLYSSSCDSTFSRGPEVFLEDGQTLVHRSPVAPVQLVDHPERTLHLQPDSSTFIEQACDVAF
jgi:hypothetical protein